MSPLISAGGISTSRRRSSIDLEVACVGRVLAERMAIYVVGQVRSDALDVIAVVGDDRCTPVGHVEAVDVVGQIFMLLGPVVWREQPVNVHDTVVGRIAIAGETAP